MLHCPQSGQTLSVFYLGLVVASLSHFSETQCAGGGQQTSLDLLSGLPEGEAALGAGAKGAENQLLGFRPGPPRTPPRARPPLTRQRFPPLATRNRACREERGS